MPFSRKPPSLKARALQALALREHSRSELRRKLLRPVRQRPGAGSPPAQGGEPGEPTEPGPATNPHSTSAEVDALLDELQAQGLLSAERFIESRVHARAARFGNRRIQAELAQHGLQLDAQSAQALRASELDRARAVWERRYGCAPSDTPPQPAERARQMRFLAARGFSPEVIRRVVKGGLEEE